MLFLKILVYLIISNKNNAKSKNWQSKTILNRSYFKILETFARNLHPNLKGNIIAESAPSQDYELIKAHNRLQNKGVSSCNITPHEYLSNITALSLVNKENFDIDVQIADCLAPIAILKYKIESQKDITLLNRINRMKLRLLERKLKSKKGKLASNSEKLANPIVSVYDSDVHAQQVLEAFKKEFII